MNDLKIGDRVVVQMNNKILTGIISGEGRKGDWWNIVKDGTKYPQSYHKDFCRPSCPPLNQKTRCDACNLLEACSDPQCPNSALKTAEGK